MKILIGLFLFISFQALADFQYSCPQKMMVIISGTVAKPVIKLKFPSNFTKGSMINIMSNSGSLDIDPSTDEGKKVQVPHPVTFASFAYPSGSMYVSAEGDTNEEGFTFVIQEEMLKGAKNVKVATMYWSDFSATDIDNFGCARVK